MMLHWQVHIQARRAEINAGYGAVHCVPPNPKPLTPAPKAQQVAAGVRVAQHRSPDACIGSGDAH